jgi:hypothetical protein
VEPCIANVFLSTTNEMQRYAMFFVVVSALHVTSGFSAHHQELKNCTCSIGTCRTCALLQLLWLSRNWFALQFRLNQASGNNTQVWLVPTLHVQFLSSWWCAEKPLETCRALTTIKNTASCWLCLRIMNYFFAPCDAQSPFYCINLLASEFDI